MIRLFLNVFLIVLPLQSFSANEEPNYSMSIVPYEVGNADTEAPGMFIVSRMQKHFTLKVDGPEELFKNRKEVKVVAGDRSCDAQVHFIRASQERAMTWAEEVEPLVRIDNCLNLSSSPSQNLIFYAAGKVIVPEETSTSEIKLDNKKQNALIDRMKAQSIFGKIFLFEKEDAQNWNSLSMEWFSSEDINLEPKVKFHFLYVKVKTDKNEGKQFAEIKVPLMVSEDPLGKFTLLGHSIIRQYNLDYYRSASNMDFDIPTTLALKLEPNKPGWIFRTKYMHNETYYYYVFPNGKVEHIHVRYRLLW